MNKIENGIVSAGLDAVPLVRAKRLGANQPITNTTWTLMVYDSEVFDTDTIHDTSTNQQRLTAKTAGKYLVIATISFVNNGTGERIMVLQKNTDVAPAGTFEAQQGLKAMAVGATTLSCQALVDMAVNDFVCCCVWQNSGGTLDVTTNCTDFSMVRMGV